MLKKLITLCLCILLCLPASAEAPLTLPYVSVALGRTVFTGPVPVEVAVTVTATEDMPGPCALYGPDGGRIADFGTPTLKAGESVSWAGVWQVTEQHLTQERICFALAFGITAADGTPALHTQPYAVMISAAGNTADAAAPRVEATLAWPAGRTSGPAEVTLTFTVAQDMTGPCALYDADGMRITDFGTPTLRAGEPLTWTGPLEIGDAHLSACRPDFALAYDVMEENGTATRKYVYYTILIPETEAGAAGAPPETPLSAIILQVVHALQILR